MLHSINVMVKVKVK